MAASVGSNADDEHDVEGASIAFERAHVQGLLDRARVRAAALQAALGRLAAGTYGRCEHCGEAIGADRLAARPEAVRCISCAR